MAISAVALCASILASGAQGLLLQNVAGGQVGSCNPPRWNAESEPAAWPYNGHHAEREELGERLLKATSAEAAVIKACEGFVMYGDYIWCAKAFPRKRAGSVNQKSGFTFQGKTDLEGQPNGEDFLALSFGIRERDMWSELISNRHMVPSELYDCYSTQKTGPMGEADLYKRDAETSPCPSWRQQNCYGAPYKVHRVCGGRENKVFHADRELKFVTLGSTLAGQGNLSVHVKMDVEGSEWDVLSQLLSSEEDMAKIRTLDMEVHLNKYSCGARCSDQFPMERKVAIMEELAQKFAVVGTTVDALHTALKDKLVGRMLRQKTYREEEPQIYTKSGFSLDQYAISFVNRKLVQ